MEKGEWGECWAHFVAALGLPDDGTRRRQGEAWFAEFARSRKGDVVKRAMRRVLNAMPAGQSFPDLGIAREHFAAEDRLEVMETREKLPPCDRCGSSGRVTLVAYRSHGRVLWMNAEDYFDAFDRLPTNTAHTQVQCQCPRGEKFQKFPIEPGDAAAALAKFEDLYGAATAADVMIERGAA